MLQLLRFLSWRHLRRHRLRTFLTLSGIALGVAVIIAIAMVNRALTSSFERTINLIAGKAVLQATNGEAGFRESLFPSIRDTAGVLDAAPAVEGFLPIVGFPGERLYVYGVDLLIDFAVREHEFVGEEFGFDRALDFIAQPDSVALTESLARRLGFSLGSEIKLSTSRGVRGYTVRALLKERGTARAFGGNFAMMDLPVAQIAFGKEGKLDIVDVTVEPGTATEEVKTRLAAKLSGTAEVQRPRERGEQIEMLLTSFRVGLFFVSLIALFVGFFLIYNTVSVSVVQRKRELGTLRCLGLLRRHILALIICEAALVAALGSLAGVVVGLGIAEAALLAVGETVGNLFSQIELTRAAPGAAEFWLASASGIGVSVLAALHPAWQATRVSPLVNARQALWSPAFRGIRSASSLLGFACLLLSPFILMLSPAALGPVGSFSLGVLAMLVFLLGLSLLSPLFIFHWVRFFWRWVARVPNVSWAEARLASDSLRRNPLRSGISVATLLISLAAIFTIAAFVHSVRGSLLSWVDQMVTADLIVSSGARTSGPRNVPLKEEPAEAMKKLAGVKVVDLYRLVRSNYRGMPILIESFSARASADVRTLPMTDGDGRVALDEMAAGKGVIISESFHVRFGSRRGDAIQLATPSGPVTFRVLGVYVDYSSDIGSVLIERALYKKFWQEDLVDAIDLWLEPGADQAAVIRRIKEKFGQKYELFISTHGELRQAVVDIMEQSFVVNYAVEIVAVIVAIFSVINTLLASVLDRTREIGVLRAIGATQSQVRKAIVMEAAWMGLLGGVLGLFAGTLMSYHHVVYNTKVLTGWTFQYHYPLDVAFLSLVLSVALCLVAGYVPARQAAATPIVAAIGYE